MSFENGTESRHTSKNSRVERVGFVIGVLVFDNDVTQGQRVRDIKLLVLDFSISSHSLSEAVKRVARLTPKSMGMRTTDPYFLMSWPWNAQPSSLKTSSKQPGY